MAEAIVQKAMRMGIAVRMAKKTQVIRPPFT